MSNGRSQRLIKLRNQNLCACFYFLKELSDLPEKEILRRMSERMFFVPVSRIKQILAADPDLAE